MSIILSRHFIFSAALLAALPSFALTYYVDVNSTNPVPPYRHWNTAANVIQDAVDVAAGRDTVLVTNGVYDTGGKAVYGTMTNRVAVDKPLTLMSVNGPEYTIIAGAKAAGGGNGDGAVRCVYMRQGASLSGSTLTNGATRKSGQLIEERYGGGVWSEHASTHFMPSVSNCVIEGNSAFFGGGSFSGNLHDCVVADNVADGYGGGAFAGTLENCTLVGNVASNGYGGGASQATLRNCIVYLNSAPYSPNHAGCGLDYSCTTPLPLGTGNITNAPLFMDTNGWANLRLQSNSPCINAGNNAYVSTTNDLDGNPRIVGGTVDMGAYEFQSPQSSISYAWLQSYGLPTDGSVDNVDDDNDKATTWQEWKAWTIPTNALSVLKMLKPDPQTNGTGVAWQSVTGHSYMLERATNSAANFTVLQSGIAGQTNTTSFTDTTATNGNAYFYRVSVPD